MKITYKEAHFARSWLLRRIYMGAIKERLTVIDCSINVAQLPSSDQGYQFVYISHTAYKSSIICRRRRQFDWRLHRMLPQLKIKQFAKIGHFFSSLDRLFFPAITMTRDNWPWSLFGDSPTFQRMQNFTHKTPKVNIASDLESLPNDFHCKSPSLDTLA